MSPCCSESDSIVTIGMAKKTRSHKPPGNTSRYGAMERLRRFMSSQRGRFERLLELLLLGRRLERDVVVQLRVVGRAREDVLALRQVLQRLALLAGLLLRVLAHLRLGVRHRAH